ncbi:hypothetical protein QAD02_020971 [Eretmocerus hayati]|uniref:Uncharacterized protein n=1 Tax=Eretmocerus hayati TaxID=131215 RepID=A0ACC2PNY7_9HYME|nr:hypothetical protein QAD02_020971 [Eretmocerus hayati]
MFKLSIRVTQTTQLIVPDGNDNDVSFPKRITRGSSQTNNATNEVLVKEVRLRQKKDITKASGRTRYRKAKELAKEYYYDVEFLEMAVKAAKAEKNIVETKEKVKVQKPVMKHSEASATALYLDLDLTKERYSALSKDSRSRNAHFLPCYPKMREEMRNCQVPCNYVSEREIRADLQVMMNKSGERLIEAVAKDWPENHLECVEYTVTIGSDASSRHTNPQIGWKNKEDEIRDSQLSLFITMMLIVSLKSTTGDSGWVNPTPQSYRLCCPLRIYVGKETNENIQEENMRIKSEISRLHDHSFTLCNGKKVGLRYKVFQTMYDGKCVNAMTGNACSSNCPICRCTQKQAAETQRNFTPHSPDNLTYGLGLLHISIRSAENFLQLAYKSPIKSWSVRGEENKGNRRLIEEFPHSPYTYLLIHF